MVNHAIHFEYSFISVNRLKARYSDFAVNTWILDSGAFTELAKYGHYRNEPEDYACQINRWKVCGNLEFAVTQDYMCEPFILLKTGMNLKEHQQLTVLRYHRLLKLTDVPILPVLQGYEPEDYVEHLRMYGGQLAKESRVGVGSICKRNGKPLAIIKILETIKGERPDLKLHGFGLKTTALENAWVAKLLYSADSMAWSYAARRNGRNANGLSEALSFYKEVNHRLGNKAAQLELKC